MQKVYFLLFIISFNLIRAQNFDSLLFVSLKIDQDTERVNLFYKQGFAARLSAPQFAYNCAKQAEYFGLHSKSSMHLAKAYNLLGVLYYRKGDLKSAIDFHQKALELRESINDEPGIAISETNLGNIYSDLRKNEIAEKSYLHALQLNNKIGNEKQCGNCFINLGVLKLSENNLEEGEKYFYSALKIAKVLMDYELEALCLNNLAVINIERKDYESAVGNSLDALKAKDLMGNEIEKTDSYINLAKAYFYLNDATNSNYYLNKADSFCSAYNYTEARSALLQLRSKIFEITQKYELSLINYKAYVHLKDSINEANKELAEEFNFVEDEGSQIQLGEPFHFPYFMIFVLLISSFAGVYIIYSNKR